MMRMMKMKMTTIREENECLFMRFRSRIRPAFDTFKADGCAVETLELIKYQAV